MKELDFSTVTACGENCGDCERKRTGGCPGCIEADGFVPEWIDSGRCPIHLCAREHGARFCGLCREFPCEKLPSLMHWNPDITAHLTRLREEYRRQYPGEFPKEG